MDPMTSLQFTVMMRLLNIPPNAYCLDGGHPAERYCIARTETGWKYYYSERGYELELKEFKTKGAALDHLCKVLIDVYRDIRRPR
jgi:hypothetical protein